MPYDELTGWLSYFEARPVEWRDDERTYKLLRVQGVKAEATTLFPSLAAISKSAKDDSDSNVRGLRSSALFKRMLGAKGGDKISID